ncbi:uncharacterized protein K460DRAFT_132068 [Cucurbitaria berberidis CBS 394.84]|uniref:Uncharacterized protein n=1 Tax=Cucurbitaria berberidis CBS 394.84 TaxID=1168544 RepID=A0A9P4GKG3_9PLEO|nr:uncharacterized protein K460DRAFT_132068 [Cucurbitaria berberidis CBS 394.84]KAF1846849.1 hypothetical protein K460DRAFT_132068 [Cucurbitaria berberidis CBS 394.84]
MRLSEPCNVMPCHVGLGWVGLGLQLARAVRSTILPSSGWDARRRCTLPRAGVLAGIIERCVTLVGGWRIRYSLFTTTRL